MRHAIIVFVFILSAALQAQTPKKPVVAPAFDLATLTLVKTSDTEAVVRFGASPAEVIAVGDRLGKSAASVVEIAAGRIVLEEATTAADGTPLRARIVVREGETGGRRYQRQPGVTPPPGVRPEVVVAPGDGKTSKKKPGANQ
jgi:hypothetical protein